MSVSNIRYWLALHPDINRPIGGVKQMHRLCEVLASSGRNATLIQDDESFHPRWFQSDVNTISREKWIKRSDLNVRRDVVVLPETFANVFYTYAPGLPKVIFNQNGSYTFGQRTHKPWPNPNEILKIYTDDDLFSVLCVSRYDEDLLVKCLGIDSRRVSRLVNPIESKLFCLGSKKRRQISYMPRKHTQDASIVTALLENQPWWPGWKLVPIHEKSQVEVAHILQESIAFLAFGHPEGFGLPLAEAMACGCALIGYSGLGGRELFQMGLKHGFAYEVAFGDWYGFIQGVYKLNQLLNHQRSHLLTQLSSCSNHVRTSYSKDVFADCVDDAFNRIESSLLSKIIA